MLTLVEPPIAEKNYRIRFRVHNVPSRFLYLGLAHINTTKNNQYYLNTNIGGGAYVIGGHTGFSFNHCYESQNFANTGFKFEAGDVIEIQYDSMEAVARFWNMNKGLRTVLNVARQHPNDPLCFCCVMLHTNTEVTIVPEDST